MTIFLAFSCFGLILSWIDIREHKLPNRLVLFLTLVLVCLATFSISADAIIRAVQVSGLFLLIFVLIYAIGRGSLGFGDVKYAIPCGFVIGVIDPRNWLFCVWLMFVLAGLFGLGQSMFLHQKLSREIPFGPFMTLSVFILAFNSLYLG